MILFLWNILLALLWGALTGAMTCCTSLTTRQAALNYMMEACGATFFISGVLKAFLRPCARRKLAGGTSLTPRCLKIWMPCLKSCGPGCPVCNYPAM